MAKPAGKRKRLFTELSEALHALQADAKAKGLDKMSMREINEIVAEVRREKDPLYGLTRKISLTVSERMYRELKSEAEAATGGAIAPIIRQSIGKYLERSRKPTKQSRRKK